MFGLPESGHGLGTGCGHYMPEEAPRAVAEQVNFNWILRVIVRPAA